MSYTLLVFIGLRYRIPNFPCLTSLNDSRYSRPQDSFSDPSVEHGRGVKTASLGVNIDFLVPALEISSYAGDRQGIKKRASIACIS
jgi:hypothetical protein